MNNVGEGLLRLEDALGVWPLLAGLSGYAAMERSSELIEPRDLIKAIYIADLEHVSAFWNNWEGFEKLVSTEIPGPTNSGVYINRIQYLINFDSMMRGTKENGFTLLGRASRTLQEVVAAARSMASRRTGSASTPTSRDLLFCICSHDPELSTALQESGLQLEKLAAVVDEPRESR
jgi:hypothetical protein